MYGAWKNWLDCSIQTDPLPRIQSGCGALLLFAKIPLPQVPPNLLPGWWV